MNLPDIKNADLRNKRVLIRVDFNVPLEEGKIKEPYRIEAAKKTLDYVSSKEGVRTALLSHFRRPKDKEPEFSFKNFYKEISSILGHELIFVDDCIGEKVVSGLGALNQGEILMLENVRFYKEEMSADENFAKDLAENFDVYINEAFGACHDNHASITKITHFLPSFAGFNLLKEITALEKARENFERPAIAIIGGAKADTKMDVINFFARNYDHVLIGGKIGLDAAKAGITFPSNVLLPIDYVGDNLDIGPQTVKNFYPFIDGAKTIVWNGPLGKFEDPSFAKGSEDILSRVIKNSRAYKAAGGGETVQFLRSRKQMDKFDFVSTGGGAMLEFLVKGTLPGLKALMGC